MRRPRNTPEERKHGCEFKPRYPDYPTASAERTRYEMIEQYPLFVYDCGFCGGYHISKNDPFLAEHKIRAYRKRMKDERRAACIP